MGVGVGECTSNRTVKYSHKKYRKLCITRSFKTSHFRPCIDFTKTAVRRKQIQTIKKA